jgi:hypothetical protein
MAMLTNNFPSFPPHMAPLPPPSRPAFEPFHSSSTGHQRAENRLSGSTSWRHSRTRKLAYQFGDRTGGGGAAHVADRIGPREAGGRDIREMMQRAEKMGGEATRTAVPTEGEDGPSRATGEGLLDGPGGRSTGPPATAPARDERPDGTRPRPIFSGLNIYLDGSTLPHVSDHRLKHLLAQHGAAISLALGRRTVTHVILGERGGLAAGKMQKEVARTRGTAVKFVGVQWALDSIEKGTRQPERRYEVVRLAMKGQRRVS